MSKWKLTALMSLIVAVAWVVACTGSDPLSSSGQADAGSPEAGVADFALSVEPARIAIPRAGSATVAVKLARNGYDGAVFVDTAALPAGIGFAGTDVAVGAMETSATVTVDPNAPLGDAVLTVRGKATDGRFGATGSITIAVTGRPGELDDSFGKAGIGEDPLPGSNPIVTSAVESNEQITLAGFAIADAGPNGNDFNQYRPVMGRLSPAGVRDPTFAAGGLVFPTRGMISALAFDARANLVAAGNVHVDGMPGAEPPDDSPTEQAAIFRASHDGAIDSASIAATPHRFLSVLSSVVDVGGKAVAFGQSGEYGVAQIETLVAAPSTGSPEFHEGTPTPNVLNAFRQAVYDPATDTIYASNNHDVIYRIKPSALGTWVSASSLVGQLLSLRDGKLVRATPTGVASSLVDGGAPAFAVSGLPITVTAVAQQADGKVVLAGYTSSSAPEMVVVRLLADGTTDASFGTAGTVTIAVSGLTLRASALLVTQSGKIVVAGSNNIGGYGHASKVVVARLWP